ncbi:hypothetical protein MKUB_28310 [Mycobacterium kubicae]|uniref:DUF1360 domain-containing protein n=1 Tax=Mycobacterium kubicae TaxID=120959 RepID=A0AAX1J3Z4_9MYCO|nr:DUF1360 domain-containing protein [Mycobacterium kubicae]MCV7098135.1 DUF1360 domain-containing protein [Mycobacterium kubicae]OBF17341.1 hypothetical protein A5725_23465 [Mycobacterium kubicae]ORW03515.1 hypothetical protein AWC13_01890 [Mycobacterium kubicae]QNI12334.1 DUF1360 domain-containing protein [Mycobacterium kubicae]QPI35852.1 DUF1360 domain-containing protein [Mycobacterium kubicae]
MAETTELGADVVNHARQQADEYRGDNPRPLGGYIVTMSTYAVIVAVSAVVAAVTGRKLPDRWRVQDLITVALGTHKLSRTVTKGSVTSPLRAPFTRYMGSGGPAEVVEETRNSSQIRHSVGELLTCPFCFDMWVATGFAIGLVFAPKVTRMVAGTFAALTGADFLQLAYSIAQQSAEG